MRDFTHDAHARSWVSSANADATDFPIQNLPFGRFRRAGSAEPMRIGVAIGTRCWTWRRWGSSIRRSPCCWARWRRAT